MYDMMIFLVVSTTLTNRITLMTNLRIRKSGDPVSMFDGSFALKLLSFLSSQLGNQSCQHPGPQHIMQSGRKKGLGIRVRR